MLRLRTKWGINILEIKLMLEDKHYDKFMRSVLFYNDSDYLRIDNNTVNLTEKGYFISDSIIRNLFIVA